MYKKYAARLVESGHAYRCFCSETRLELLRKEAAKNREIPRYDNRCRNLTAAEVAKNVDSGVPHTLRLKLVPGDISFQDEIYGNVTIDLSQKEADPIILKSDGFPTYHLANVVDDHLMEITHVLRGVEWQTSTPKHLMLYDAFGWEAPTFAHLPLIMNRDGTKLSKRQGDIQIDTMRRNGYLAETLTSYLSNIGGGFGKQEVDEILSLDQMSSKFKMSAVNKHSCRIDPSKMLLYSRLAFEHRLRTNPNSLIFELRSLLKDKFGPEVAEQYSDDALLSRLKWSTVIQ